jgi:hypothetical protein
MGGSCGLRRAAAVLSGRRLFCQGPVEIALFAGLCSSNVGQSRTCCGGRRRLEMERAAGEGEGKEDGATTPGPRAIFIRPGRPGS